MNYTADVNTKKTNIVISDCKIISIPIEVDLVKPDYNKRLSGSTNNNINTTVLETDPIKCVINDGFRDYIAENGIDQYTTNDFLNFKHIYKTKYLATRMLNRKLINGETKIVILSIADGKE